MIKKNGHQKPEELTPQVVKQLIPEGRVNSSKTSLLDCRSWNTCNKTKKLPTRD